MLVRASLGLRRSEREVTMSRPVGGVLFPRSVAGSRVVAIHLSGPPGDALRGERAGTHVPGSALLPMGVASRPGRPGRWCALTAPFHPCLCGVTPAIGGLLSVARSARSPPPGSRQHRALWSPDLPRRTHEGCAAATQPAHRHHHCGRSRVRPARSPYSAGVSALAGSTISASFGTVSETEKTALGGTVVPRRSPHTA